MSVPAHGAPRADDQPDRRTLGGVPARGVLREHRASMGRDDGVVDTTTANPASSSVLDRVVGVEGRGRRTTTDRGPLDTTMVTSLPRRTVRPAGGAASRAPSRPPTIGPTRSRRGRRGPRSPARPWRRTPSDQTGRRAPPGVAGDGQCDRPVLPRPITLHRADPEHGSGALVFGVTHHLGDAREALRRRHDGRVGGVEPDDGGHRGMHVAHGDPHRGALGQLACDRPGAADHGVFPGARRVDHPAFGVQPRLLDERRHGEHVPIHDIGHRDLRGCHVAHADGDGHHGAGENHRQHRS